MSLPLPVVSTERVVSCGFRVTVSPVTLKVPGVLTVVPAMLAVPVVPGRPPVAVMLTPKAWF
jgi:hypothetical protein